MIRTPVALPASFANLAVDQRPAVAQPEVTLWFPRSWKEKSAAVRKIAEELGNNCRLAIVPRIADSNMEIPRETTDAVAFPLGFNSGFIVPFDFSSFDYTLSLMEKAGIDPQSHVWTE